MLWVVGLGVMAVEDARGTLAAEARRQETGHGQGRDR